MQIKGKGQEHHSSHQVIHSIVVCLAEFGILTKPRDIFFVVLQIAAIITWKLYSSNVLVQPYHLVYCLPNLMQWNWILSQNATKCYSNFAISPTNGLSMAKFQHTSPLGRSLVMKTALYRTRIKFKIRWIAAKMKVKVNGA